MGVKGCLSFGEAGCSSLGDASFACWLKVQGLCCRVALLRGLQLVISLRGLFAMCEGALVLFELDCSSAVDGSEGQSFHV